MTTVTAKDYLRITADAEAGTKYHNEPVRTDDGFFQSKREHARWGELQMLRRAKRITDLRRQVRFRLEHAGVLITTYVADFVYTRDGQQVVEDAKGMLTPAYRIKRNLMLALLGISIEEV